MAREPIETFGALAALNALGNKICGTLNKDGGIHVYAVQTKRRNKRVFISSNPFKIRNSNLHNLLKVCKSECAQENVADILQGRHQGAPINGLAIVMILPVGFMQRHAMSYIQ